MVAVKGCLHGMGYDWEFQLSEGGFQVSGGSGLGAGEDQLARESQAMNSCMTAVDPARLAPPTLSEVQLRSLYEYALSQTLCMRDAGYPVADPPPFEVYVDTGGHWEPYDYLVQEGISFAHEDLVRCRAVEERPAFLDQ